MINTLLANLLNRIEVAGNRIPHPTVLFFYLCLLVIVLSWLCAALGITATHPVSGNIIAAESLLNQQGLADILTRAVSNFTSFAPVGVVVVAMLGIGIADKSGLIDGVMRLIVLRAPGRLLSFSVILAGILSSIAADSGYVVLIPLAASLFVASGRSPLVGIAAAFAGVSAGYSANLAIGPLDAMLSGITTEAGRIIDPSLSIGAAANYYFMAASTIFIALVITWVTETLVAPRYESNSAGKAPTPSVDIAANTDKPLRLTGLFSLAFIAVLVLCLAPENGLLRSASGTILDGPFIKGIVSIIALYFALAGIVFGYSSGKFKRSDDVIRSMEDTVATMANYLVLMFFAAQFVNYFAWTNLGIITAINGAELLQSADLGSSLILLLFVIMAAGINLLIGSASAKWSVMAPIFVPMFMLVGIAPEASQVAYRIGDSSTNIITPLMPYFGIVVAFAQQHDRKAGIGTIIAMMLPYSLCLLISWTALLALWLALGWPFGAS